MLNLNKVTKVPNIKYKPYKTNSVLRSAQRFNNCRPYIFAPYHNRASPDPIPCPCHSFRFFYSL